MTKDHQSVSDIWDEVDGLVKKANIPIHVILEVTRKCNLKCLHCYNLKDKSSLSLHQIHEIMQQLRQAGCLFITLTGGELFARPDACDILLLARQHGFDIKLITNGTLITEEIADCLQRVSPGEVGVSVLGATAKTHDKITGLAGSFHKAISGIKLLRKRGVAVHIKCTLMRENIHEYKEIVALAKQLGVIYLIDPIISPRDDGSTDVLDYRLSEQDLKEFYIKEFQQRAEDENPIKKKGAFPCEAGTTFAAISANGDVYPCIQLPRQVGNVFEKNFKNIWQNAPLLHMIRNATDEDLKGCDCHGTCNRCPGLAYLESGDMFGPAAISCFIDSIYKKYQKDKVA